MKAAKGSSMQTGKTNMVKTVKVGVPAPTLKKYYDTIGTNLPSNPKQRATATELKNIQERKRRNY